MDILLLSIALILVFCLFFRRKSTLNWTDYKTVFELRLVWASKSEYQGYKFQIINYSRSLWKLKITHPEGYPILDDICLSMSEGKHRAEEVIIALKAGGKL